MKVINVADVTPPIVQAESTVAETLRVMEKAKRGACLVLESDQLVGIFSERDLMLRAIRDGTSLGDRLVGELMSENLSTVSTDMDSGEALKVMLSQNVRHLPVINEDGSLAGLLSMRDLMKHHVEELTDQLDSVVAYFSADGPGG